MNSDIRYHIASLSAVFLALGIGILVGTAFVGTPVVQRQTTLIRRLEENVGDLRRETAARDNMEKALVSLAPGIITGKLTGKQVLVVQSGTYSSAADAAVATLEQAGAAVSRVSLPIDAWRREVIRTTATATATAARAAADSGPAADAIGAEAAHIAALLLRGEPAEGPSPLQVYRDRGLLISESSSGGPFRLVVLVSGTSMAAATSGATEESALQTFIQQRDLPLVAAWTANGATVVAAEPLESGVTFLRLYQDSGIATIDSIDHAVGQIALPLALLGEKGNYGLRPGADRALPLSVESLHLAPLSPPSPAPTVRPSPSSSVIASPAAPRRPTAP